MIVSVSMTAFGHMSSWNGGTYNISKLIIEFLNNKTKTTRRLHKTVSFEVLLMDMISTDGTHLVQKVVTSLFVLVVGYKLLVALDIRLWSKKLVCNESVELGRMGEGGK